MWHKCIICECWRRQAGIGRNRQCTGEVSCRVNKATWTGLQRGSSMSRFLLVDSLVAVGSSVLLYVIGLIEKNGRKTRSFFWFSLAISSVRRFLVLRFFPSLLPLSSRPPPFDASVTSTPCPPLSLSLLPLYHSTYPSLSFSLAFLDFSSSRSLSPIDLTVYLSICLSLRSTACRARHVHRRDVKRTMPDRTSPLPRWKKATDCRRRRRRHRSLSLSLSPSLALSLSISFLFFHPVPFSLRGWMPEGGGGGRPRRTPSLSLATWGNVPSPSWRQAKCAPNVAVRGCVCRFEEKGV